MVSSAKMMPPNRVAARVAATVTLLYCTMDGRFLGELLDPDLL